MPPPRAKFRQAESRENMRAINAWIPETLHRQLSLARIEDGISVNEVVRQALTAWVAGRKRKARR